MTLSGICASLWVVGHISPAWRDRDLGGYLSLEGLQDHLLELIDLLSAEPFVSIVSELLSLKADTRMKLHFETLVCSGLDSLTVDAFVLLAGPRILEFE